MNRIFLLCLLSTFSCVSHAVLDKCNGVYVGRISLDIQGGLNRVVFLEGTQDTSGSFWVYFTGWESDAKHQALSILMAAKLSGHRLNVFTKAPDKCSIDTGGQVIAGIDLATNP